MRARQLAAAMAAVVVLMSVGGVASAADGDESAPEIDGCVLAPDASCPGVDLSGRDLTGVDLTRADLSGANLRNANLSGAVLEWTDLVGADLSSAMLTGARLRGTDFSGSVLVGADLTGADGPAADFSWADLTRVRAGQSQLSGAFFGNATVTGADFSGAVLAGADFSNADLATTTTDAATVCPDGQPGPCPARAPEEDPEDDDGLAGGRIINGCRIAPKTTCPGADLRDQNLSAVRLNGSDLSKAKLNRADLTYADLSNADLSGADLTGADLDDAVLDGTKLTGAILCGTRIRGGVDNSGCSDTCVDAAISSQWKPAKMSGRIVGSLALVPYSRVPNGMLPLNGMSLPISQYIALYSQVGDAFGGSSGRSFDLPRATGSWSGLSGLPTGTRTCLTWAIVVDGDWPPYSEANLLPNEVFFTAALPQRVATWEWVGELLPGLSSRIASGVSGFTALSVLDEATEVPLGELRLFRGSALPKGFLPADGRELDVKRNEGLYSLLGEYAQGRNAFRLPKIEAPKGYTWGISTAGPYPTL